MKLEYLFLCMTNNIDLFHSFRPYVAESRIRNVVPNPDKHMAHETMAVPVPINRTIDQRGKETTNFRKKEKEILDKVLDNSTYDRRIRPSGHQNDTSELGIVTE